jgi:hypothetical protein
VCDSQVKVTVMTYLAVAHPPPLKGVTSPRAPHQVAGVRWRGV